MEKSCEHNGLRARTNWGSWGRERRKEGRGRIGGGGRIIYRLQNPPMQRTCLICRVRSLARLNSLMLGDDKQITLPPKNTSIKKGRRRVR